MPQRWVTLLGKVETDAQHIQFKGGPPILSPAGTTTSTVAVAMSSETFGGGTITANFEFVGPVTPEDTFGVILYRDPTTAALIEAQIGGLDLCSVWTLAGQWHRYAGAGLASTLEPQRKYGLEIEATSSIVRMTVDGVGVLSTILPFPLPRGNAGLWFRGATEIRISDFKIQGMTPRAFVVMQFSPPYNELYSDVIKPVCESLRLHAVRADDTFGPGVIIKDIERQILEAQIIIADITPANLNVYYEVGYAHALRKDTILIAEKPTELPFDVSPFRVLFYENTIAGKAKVEAGLRKHLQAILGGGETVTV